MYIYSEPVAASFPEAYYVHVHTYVLLSLGYMFVYLQSPTTLTRVLNKLPSLTTTTALGQQCQHRSPGSRGFPRTSSRKELEAADWL